MNTEEGRMRRSVRPDREFLRGRSGRWKSCWLSRLSPYELAPAPISDLRRRGRGNHFRRHKNVWIRDKREQFERTELSEVEDKVRRPGHRPARSGSEKREAGCLQCRTNEAGHRSWATWRKQLTVTDSPWRSRMTSGVLHGYLLLEKVDPRVAFRSRATSRHLSVALEVSADARDLEPDVERLSGTAIGAERSLGGGTAHRPGADSRSSASEPDADHRKLRAAAR